MTATIGAREVRSRIEKRCINLAADISTLLVHYPHAFLPGEILHLKRVRDGLRACAERIEQNEKIVAIKEGQA